MLDDTDWWNFEKEFEIQLKKQKIPDCINCRDVHCQNTRHIQDVDTYIKDVLDAVDLAITSVASTKRQNISSAKVVPGWSDLVKPFCDDAKFWHAIWLSAGKPINTELHQIMKRSKNI